MRIQGDLLAVALLLLTVFLIAFAAKKGWKAG